MKTKLLTICLILTSSFLLLGFFKGETRIISCNSSAKQTSQAKWKYNKKEIIEIKKNGDHRIYEVDYFWNYGLSIYGSNEGKFGMHYVIVDLEESDMEVRVINPYGGYTDKNCKRLN